VIFAQKLASNEKNDRDKAVRRLKKWFYSRSSVDSNCFTEDELMRIWKGLFYCYWQSDKPLIQEELAESISSMIGYFATEETALLFIKTFLLTMGREWFGIDAWRMNKFMMLVRRFVRQIFKYNKKCDWRLDLGEKITQLFKENLLMCDITKTSLALQIHTTDVYLEELAKVGREELEYEVIDLYLQPFYKVLTKCREARLRSHVHEAVFNHLLRQSDPGIQWEAQKDVQELKNVEILDEVGEDMEYADENVKENGGQCEDVIVDDNAEDPRAGLVNVEIPQLQVDYLKIADKLFELGSLKNIRSANRNILYTISKHFKDVGNGVFPLGDELSDVEEIPKYNVKESVEDLNKMEEIISKRNVKAKAEARIMFLKNKKSQKMQKEVNDSDDNEDLENGWDDESVYGNDEDGGGIKRKLNEDVDDFDQSPETKKAKIEENKQRKREHEKRRKQEQKKRKREKMLAHQLNLMEENRKVDSLIHRDLEIKAVATDENKENNKPHKKIKKVEKVIVNNGDHGERNEKNKEDKAQDKDNKVNGIAEATLSELVEKEPQSDQSGSCKTNTENVNGLVNGDPEVRKKKKKKNKKAKCQDNENRVNGGTISMPVEKQEIGEKVRDKSKKKKDKSLKKENILPKPDESKSSSIKEKKHKKEKSEKDAKIIANIEGQTDKTEKVNETSGKVFAESSDWDEPLQPGEQEIVIPSKKYKGDQKLKPAKSCSNGFKEYDSPKGKTPKSCSNGFKEFDSPTVTTPKSMSHTAKFLKKAMSQSATPKKKLSQIEKLKAKGSSSESRIKKVNFALTKNMMQDVEEMHAQIKLSPAIPHDPKKAPEKSLLKRTVLKKALEREGSPQLNPVSLNTQLNSSISKKGNKIHGKNMKRMMARQFF